MVLDSGTLGLAPPSSRLDSGPLRSAVIDRSRLESLECRTEVPGGAFVLRLLRLAWRSSNAGASSIAHSHSFTNHEKLSLSYSRPEPVRHRGLFAFRGQNHRQAAEHPRRGTAEVRLRTPATGDCKRGEGKRKSESANSYSDGFGTLAAPPGFHVKTDPQAAADRSCSSPVERH
jgi:hypothetical protein